MSKSGDALESPGSPIRGARGPPDEESVALDAPSTSTSGNRKELIDTAVRFLTNEKVRHTPLEQQQDFLAKKGLTASEIQEAIAKAGPSIPRVPPGFNAGPGMAYPPMGAPGVPVVNSSWRDYANTAVLVGGTSYALYRLAREYILPTFFGVASPEQERVRRLEESVSELHNSVKFLCDSVQQMLSALQENQQTMTRLAVGRTEEDTSKHTSTTMNELKNELSIVKGLLLNKNQFPPPIVKSGIDQIVKVPAWQLKNGNWEQSASSVMTNGESSKKKKEDLEEDGEDTECFDDTES